MSEEMTVGAAIGRPPEAEASDKPAAIRSVPSSASLRSAPAQRNPFPQQSCATGNKISLSPGQLCPQGEGSGSTAALEITIHEGRNRQIRRMAQAAGLTVTRLKRIAEGPVTLGDLKPGQWRRLTEAELAAICAEQ